MVFATASVIAESVLPIVRGVLHINFGNVSKKLKREHAIKATYRALL